MTNTDNECRIRAVEATILAIRGQKVILDADLARVHGVPTKALNQAVKRNPEKFPEDFAFRLTAQEVTYLKSQSVTSSDDAIRSQFVTGSATTTTPSRSQFVTLKRRQNIKYLPHAFTEHGAIMATTVLNSPQAVRMSVFVVRAFVKMREYLLNRAELEKRLADIEKTLLAHDTALRDVYQKIRPLLFPPPAEPPRRQIGFGVKERRARYIVKRKGK
jgi:hypothetical protein